MAPSHPYEPTWQSLDKRAIPTWFNEAKFGIFIHWGIYSVPAWRPLSSERYASYAEWYYATVIDDLEMGGDAFHRRVYGEDFEYRDFAPMFKAELFDPDFWADLFSRAGANYVVLTAKHHDGFCLWPTKSPYKKNWHSLDIGPHRDLVGELTEAVRAKGMCMGLYYSIVEFESTRTQRRPSGYFLDKKTIDRYRIPEDKYVDEHLLPQLQELVLNYQPSLIYSDGGEWDEDENYWKTREFLAWLYNEAPNRDEVVVNDRWAKGMPGVHGDYFSSEYKDAEEGMSNHPWEESRGIGGSYGLNRAETIDDYSTSGELIHELVSVVSRGGNFLLNVGPTADGRIPLIMQQRLLDIGAWLWINGESIYGTQAWSKSAMDDKGVAPTTFFTKKSNDLYVICTEWPRSDLIIPGAVAKEGTTVQMLGLAQPIQWTSNDHSILIKTPQVSPTDIPCRYAYVFKIQNSA